MNFYSYLKTITSLLAICSFNTQAVIVRVDHLLNKMPEISARRFILYSEIHDPASPITEEQLSQLKQALIAYDSTAHEKAESMHIFIEEPSQSGYFTAPLKQYQQITSELGNAIAECANIRTENIEIRCYVHAAAFLFSSKLPPHEWQTDFLVNSRDHQCRVGDVKMIDVINELNREKESIDAWKKSCHQDKIAALDRYEYHFGCLFEQIQSYLSGSKIDLNEPLFLLSQKLYENDPEGRSYLSKRILEASCVLLDMTIIQKILSTQKETTLMLIAGATHVAQIESTLEDWGNEVIVSHGIVSCDSVVPLLGPDLISLAPEKQYCTLL